MRAALPTAPDRSITVGLPDGSRLRFYATGFIPKKTRDDDDELDFLRLLSIALARAQGR
jgi:hypothetical protein